MKKVGGLILILAIVAALFFWCYNSYKSIESCSDDMTDNWAKVENACQRRSDIATDLIASYRNFFTNLAVEDFVIAREKAAGISVNFLTEESILQFHQAQNQIVKALDALLEEGVPAESSSDVSGYHQMVSSLEANEIMLSEAQQRFNTSSSLYNNLILKFPANIVAATFGYTARGYLPSD